METQKCKDFIPNRLYDFIAWCTSKEDIIISYASETDMGNIEMRVIAICHNMISLVCKIHTPITFGLGVKLHHDYGSRELIDGVSSLDEEVSRFHTAIALDQLSSKSDVHIPRDISVYDPENVRTTVDAAIDNFNQNEQTIDRKNITHSMDVVLYQRCPRKHLVFQEQTKKPLDAQSCDEDEIKRYNKPILNQNHV